jgi:hypothetical protein
MSAKTIAQQLAGNIDALCLELLPNGHREGPEWRCGSVSGEAGNSLGIHLTGNRRGVWADFASDQSGDALDLVAAVFGYGKYEALCWSERWLGIEPGEAESPRPHPASARADDTAPDPDKWKYPWSRGTPIAGTIAEAYLAARGLHYLDLEGEVLRFVPRRARRSPTDTLEHHPCLIALLRGIHDGASCGVINIHLQPNGTDRLRDKKGKTVTGRARGAAVMLDEFEDVTCGLTICEGLETGLALRLDEQRPVWVPPGAGNLAAFPVLDVIEALTVAADADGPGQRAAQTVAARWRAAGQLVAIVAPKHLEDWAAARQQGEKP